MVLTSKIYYEKIKKAFDIKSDGKGITMKELNKILSHSCDCRYARC